MSEIKINKIVGDSFEDMSITEMTMVQGSGDDISGEFTTSPACVALSVAFSATIICKMRISGERNFRCNFRCSYFNS